VGDLVVIVQENLALAACLAGSNIRVGGVAAERSDDRLIPLDLRELGRRVRRCKLLSRRQRRELLLRSLPTRHRLILMLVFEELLRLQLVVVIVF